MSAGKTVSRPLTQQERDLVQWLLEHGKENSSDLIPQIEKLTVNWECECGCPTVNFAFDGEAMQLKGARIIISDYLAKVGGMEVGVMLFQTEEHLSSLEIYSLPGHSEPFGLPSIESLYPFEDASKNQ